MNKYKAYVVGTVFATAITLYTVDKPESKPKYVTPEIIFSSQPKPVSNPKLVALKVHTVPKQDNRLAKLKEKYQTLSTSFTPEDKKHMSSTDLKKLEFEVFKNTDLIVTRLERENVAQ